ncbi:Esterase FrsA [Sodalis praecaptivus]
MYLDVMASRIGMAGVADGALKTELNSYSLKVQGLLGRSCPTPILAGCWPDDPFSPPAEAAADCLLFAGGKAVAD